jgi:hypothetical protein
MGKLDRTVALNRGPVTLLRDSGKTFSPTRTCAGRGSPGLERRVTTDWATEPALPTP